MNRNRIIASALLLSSAVVISVTAAVEAPFTVCTWENDCKAAVSHTFDDNTAGQTGAGQQAFDAKGFKMTLFTVTGSMNPNWNNLKNAFEKGHEIASHSVSHGGTMSDNECPTSQSTIKEKVPGEKCITVAYPNCNIPNPQTQLQKCYIAGRICDGQIANKSPSDFYRIGAIMAGSAGTNSTSGFNSKADEAASKNGWLVWCHHGVGNDGHGYSNTNLDALKGNLDYLDNNRSKFWTATFGSVARYIKERNAASLAVKTTAANSITISLTDNLVDSVYDYPLTIRRPLPDGWTDAVVTQGTEEVDDTILTVDGTKIIQFKAVPDGGDIVIESGTMVKNRALKSANSNLLTFNNSTLSIDAAQFSGSTIAVSLFDLKGKLFAKYSVNKSASRVSVPLGAFSNSLFVAKITDGNVTVVSRCMQQ
ncbi:MAG TPA: polysaccharide deacetylase family protein [Chitinispirillaceae bacterium]|nr:polysaccharide deacetylase family protein [Chitinispirillaceae bacterium]